MLGPSHHRLYHSLRLPSHSLTSHISLYLPLGLFDFVSPAQLTLLLLLFSVLFLCLSLIAFILFLPSQLVYIFCLLCLCSLPSMPNTHPTPPSHQYISLLAVTHVGSQSLTFHPTPLFSLPLHSLSTPPTTHSPSQSGFSLHHLHPYL